jgi:two-component system cell cycle sensor histidine kinase/response regulator CckA
LDQQQKKKILIMDDEIMVGEIACQMLEFFGFEGVHVTEGTAAVKEYAAQKEINSPYTAVIMDLTIPGGMGGKAAVKEILDIDHDARVYVSSGYSGDPAMVHFVEYGFVGAIAKPFDLATIQNMLNSLA